MTEPDQFDQFYKDVRTRLLLLTYCLTGDLPSSRAAVRDAFVVAWHHWRKVARLDDPEAWVRERACRDAQRRHTAKLWHREKNLDPEVKATLDALGRLSMTQRRVLLLSELTRSSMTSLSREVGLPRNDAERQLQTATSGFALHRQVSTTQVRSVLESVRPHVEGTRWPRPTILRRAGATRRRTHTVIGVAATAAALVVTGTLVTDADGARPSLAEARVDGPSGPTAPQPVKLPEDSMLDVASVSSAAATPGWTLTSTSDNSSGNGLVMACQGARYAGPRQPDAALVRTFQSGATAKAPATTVVQAAQAARNDRVAGRSYAAAVGWFADCHDDRAQLVTTYDVTGVGDQATLLELHTWAKPDQTVLAGVARTGQFTTVTTSSTPGTKGPQPAAVAALLAASVNKLCELPEGGACAAATTPTPTAVAPVPVAPAPGMLAEIDLPPAHGVGKPWVGTEPRRALSNAAATSCDDADFSSPAMTNNLTRTFLVPEAKLPAEFGLTESVGALPAPKAKAFVANVRTALDRCGKKHMGTKVVRLKSVKRGDTELAVWRVTTEVTDDRTLSFLMGIVRDGTGVAQVGFVPVKGVTISDDDFQALTQRALERLAELPPPRVG